MPAAPLKRANPMIWALCAGIPLGVLVAIIEQRQPGSFAAWPIHPAQLTGGIFLLAAVAAIAWNKARAL